MKKYIWGLTAAILIGAVVFLWLIKTPMLSSYLTNKMRVPVSIGWVGLGIDHVTFHSLRIKNPPGFREGAAFRAHEITCQYQLSKLFANPAVIEQILVQTSTLRIDFSNALGSRNNWTEIAERMGPKKGSAEVFIRKLILSDFTVEIRGLGAKGLLLKVPKTKHFDRLEFDNIDSKKGFPTDELIQQIFQGAGIQQYIQDLLSPLKNPQNLLNPLPFFGEATES